MLFPRFRAGGRLRRPTLLLLVIVLVAGVWVFDSLGRILHHEDPLEQVDLIFVLGGTRMERPAEAGHLVLEGWSRKILLSLQHMDGAEIALRARGVRIEPLVETQRETLIQMGVPADAIDALKGRQLTTATEMRELRALWDTHRWPRIMVVTSKLHTTRARLTLRRNFEGTGVRLIVRASRYDPAEIDRWWYSRAALRDGLFEAQKLLAYWIGLAD